MKKKQTAWFLLPNHFLWRMFLYAVLLLFLFLILFQYTISSNEVHVSELKTLYENSKYMKGEKGNAISDDVVYMYAGWAYINGELPLAVNFEHPPFAKYLWGISITAFGNPYVVNTLMYLIFACIYFGIVQKTLSTWMARFLVLSVVTVNPLLVWYSHRIMLDGAQLLFMSLVLFVGIFYKESKHIWSQRLLFVCTGILGGLYLSSKYPFPFSIGFLGLFFGWMLLDTSAGFVLKNILYFLWRYCLLWFLTSIAYAATYIPQYLYSGKSFVQIVLQHLSFEWWRLHWFMGKLDTPKGYVFQTILFGKHASWWNPDLGGVTYDTYSLIWPFVFVLFLGSFTFLLYRFIKTRQTTLILLLGLWSAGALCLLALGASNDFYLLPIFPWMSLVSGVIPDTIGTVKPKDHNT